MTTSSASPPIRSGTDLLHPLEKLVQAPSLPETSLVVPVGFGPRTTPGRLDGIEPIDKRLLLASQTDSTIVLMDGGTTRAIIKVMGAPADIGVDTKRRRVAVPYVALNRVDIWQLPLKS